MHMAQGILGRSHKKQLLFGGLWIPLPKAEPVAPVRAFDRLVLDGPIEPLETVGPVGLVLAVGGGRRAEWFC